VKIYRKITLDKNIQFIPADIRLTAVYKSDSFEKNVPGCHQRSKKTRFAVFAKLFEY
jgi:hypothetical protein